MNAQKSRKFIVAGGMAGVVAIGIGVFALRSHSVAPVAQAALPPAATLAPAPAAEAVPSAALADAAPAVAKVPEAPAPVALKDSGGTQSAAFKSVATASSPAVEPKVARSRPLPKTEDSSSVASTGTVTPTGPAFDGSARLAAETVAAATLPAATAPVPTEVAASSVDSVKSTDLLAAAPATSSTTAASGTPDPSSTPATGTTPVADQAVAASPVAAASDSQITTAVKSEMAVDGVAKNANIGVTTTDGVVALTGSLTSQDAIDHVKDTAGKVKDVKRVDTTALILASL